MNTFRSIGIFGGSFDPVHNGHVLVARAALEELALDRLFIVPAARSPFKPEEQPAPPAARLRLLQLAFAGCPNCEIDPQETERDGVSYSIETIRTYAERHPEAKLHYLIGADHVPTLPQWREAVDLAKLAEFVVVPRPGQVVANFPEPFRGQTLNGWPFEVSSSAIRERLKLGKAIDGLVPSVVAESLQKDNPYT
ncbi:MAG: nicotinate (nicotinamide) nucleotide adenylyltransferase [Verrucomicrobiota bacterium]|nr:nicotinate (nicotinamide) nucleotide adenylyltransferase [Verrucomicrobiota bacterium]